MYIKIAIAIAQAYKEREEAKKEEDKARKILKRVSDEIQAHTAEIIETMETLRIERLQGHFNGMLRLFTEYEPIPQNEQPLNNLITDSGFFILGELEVILNRDDVGLETYLQALDIYSITSNLRALAMKERKYTFGVSTDDHIITMFKDNLKFLKVAVQKLTNIVSQRKSKLDGCVNFCQTGSLCISIPSDEEREISENTKCSSEKSLYIAAQNQLNPYIELRKQLVTEIKKLESPEQV